MRSFVQWLRQPVNFIALAAAFVPFGYLLYFIQQHNLNVPRADALRTSGVVFKWASGTLSRNDIFGSYAGHITVPSYLLSLLSAQFLQWNLIVEVYFNLIIAVATFALLMYLVWRTNERIFPYVLVLSSILFFSVHQNLNWIISYHGVWFHVQFFVLLAFLAATQIENRAWGFSLAVLFGVLATFSHGAGVTSWLILGMAIALAGYRKRIYYIVVAVLTIGFFVFYAWLANVQFAEENVGSGTVIFLNDLVGLGLHALSILGNGFAGDRVPISLSVMTLTVLILLLNMWYLGFVVKSWRFHQLWLPVMAYSALVAGMIAAARSGMGGLQSSLNSYYITSTMFFWVGFVVSVALVVHHSAKQSATWHSGVMASNVLLVAGLAVLFIPSHTTKLDKLWDRSRLEHEECYMRILYFQDKPRIQQEDSRCELISQDAINHLSLYGLALMSDKQAENILPPTFSADTPIIVEGDDGWVNYNVQKWLLDGLDVTHLAPSPPQSNYQQIAFDYISNEAPDEASDQLSSVLDGQNGLWYVRRSDMETAVPGFWQQLGDDGFVPTSYTYKTRYGVEFTITRYQQLDLKDSEPVQFGDSIQMAGWTSLENRVETCAAVTVRSFWETDEPIPDGYSATLTLDHITGDGEWDFETIARADSQLTLTATDLWEPETPYLDERVLDIPCELPAGEYALRLGVYNYRDVQLLTPIMDDEPLTSDFVTLETIEVS